MIYFYSSTNKKDRLRHPITVCASNENRAWALALMSFKKHNMIGSPKLLEI